MRIFLVLGLIWAAGLNGDAWAASRDFRMVQPLVREVPLDALKANLKAYEAFPWDSRIRRQLGLTLQALVRKYHGTDITIQVDEAAADRAYIIGLTVSPYSPAVHLARAEYLLNVRKDGAWVTSPELKPLLSMLRENIKIQPGIWLASALYAARVGDRKAMKHALEKGAAVADEPFFENEFKRLSAILGP